MTGVDAAIGTDSSAYTVDGAPLVGGAFMPTFRFEIAFGAAPFVANVATSSSPGVIDLDPEWVDVTDYVHVPSGVQITRGRTMELDVTQPGSCTFTIRDLDRTFDPTNNLGPYYTLLTPNTPVRVIASFNSQDYSIFNGFVQGFPQTYDTSNRITWITVHALDALSLLSRWTFVPARAFILDDPYYGILDETNRIGDTKPVLPRGLTSSRIRTMLDAQGVPSAWMNIAQGATVCESSTPAATSSLGDFLQKTAQTEYGQLYADRNGILTFVGRQYGATAPAVQFGDINIFQTRYQSLSYDPADIRLLRNEVIRGSTTVAAVTARDYASITANGLSSDSATDLQFDDVGDALAQAQYVLFRYKDAVPRVSGLVVKPGRAPNVMFPIVLASDLGERFRISRKPLLSAGFYQDGEVEQIIHTFTSTDWTTEYMLSQPDTATYWRLDDPNYSELDVSNVIAY